MFSVAHPAAAIAATPAVAPNSVIAWGSNFLGEAGTGGTGGEEYPCWEWNGTGSHDCAEFYDYPVQAGTFTDVIAVAAGGSSSAAIVQGRAADGSADPTQNTVWMWGDGAFGQLGPRPPDVCTDLGGHSPCAKRPVQIRGPGGSGYLTGITAISDSGEDVLALRYDGTVWAWGAAWWGDLGAAAPVPNPDCPLFQGSDGTTWSNPNCSPFPVQVPGLSGVTAVTAGPGYSLAIEHHGGSGLDTVWAWGTNADGELGQGWDCWETRCGESTPVQVPGLSNVSSVATGGDGHVLAIVRGASPDGADNQLWTWGGDVLDGYSGTVATFDNLSPPHGLPLLIDKPERVLDSSGSGFFTGAVAVSSAGFASLALKYDPSLRTTTVWSWGLSDPAASGTPASPPPPPAVSWSYWLTPREVRGPGGAGLLTGVVAVGGGSDVLMGDGTVLGWGQNIYGELGVDGNWGFDTFPLAIRGVAGATAIAVGGGHLLALAPVPPPAPQIPPPNQYAPPPTPYEQLTSGATAQPPQAAQVPVTAQVLTPSTINSPPPPSGTVSTQPVATPIHVATPAHPSLQGSQLVAGAAPIPGSPGAMAPSAGDRLTPTDQLAMLRHDDSADAAWAVVIAVAAASAFAMCIVAGARSRRPPAVRPAPAWAVSRAARSATSSGEHWGDRPYADTRTRR